MEKSRDIYLDAIKGVGILCIALLHFEQGIFPSWLNIWIGMFMIATFYFASGWIHGLKPCPPSIRQTIKKRIRQLGIPYVCFSGLIIVFEIIWCLLGFQTLKILLRDIYKFLVLRGIGTLWFLPVLFLGELIFCYILLHRHRWIVAISLFLCSALICWLYYTKWMPLRDVNDIHRIIDAPMRVIIRSLECWPVIGLGYLCNRFLSARLRHFSPARLCVTSCLLIYISILVVLGYFPNLWYINQWICNIFPELGFLMIFTLIGNSLITRFFSFWGINSIIMMGTHFSIIEEIFKVMDSRILGFDSFSGWRTIFYFVITVIITYPLVWLFNSKLCFMLGKNINQHSLS